MWLLLFHLLPINNQRNEEKKVAAVEEYYASANSDESKVKFLLGIAKVGIPLFFLIFAAIYWSLGIIKYITG